MGRNRDYCSRIGQDSAGTRPEWDQEDNARHTIDKKDIEGRDQKICRIKVRRMGYGSTANRRIVWDKDQEYRTRLCRTEIRRKARNIPRYYE
jgi:hypothetical protein